MTHQNLKIIVRIAWRNLWRNRRRTTIMLVAISLGVWAMIFMSAFMRGMVNGMLVDGLNSLPGHIQIHHPDYVDDPNIENSMPEPNEELRAVLNSDAVTAWSARVRVPAMITSERESRGVMLLGIDPEYEPQLGFGNSVIQRGRFVADPNEQGIVIGEKLRATLETQVGKRVVIMSQDPQNNVADRGFKIVGVFKSSVVADEEMFVFTGKLTAQSMLRIPGMVSEIAVNGEDARDIETLFTQISAHDSPQQVSLPWYALNSYLGLMANVMDGFVLVFMIIIFLALSFGLVNTLMMAVFERVREIGLMQALGMKPATILYQVMCETFILLVLGLIIGNLTALATILPLMDGIDLSSIAQGLQMAGMSTVLTPSLTTLDFVLASSVVIVLGLLAGFMPAWKASRYRPVEALAKT
ncbi:ABC transporter permease [Arenicella chitinivorans]|uniref:ABC transporter permease n=1 Tax=Arenicella chitinivorans TaxID=1329800 RepID=A0A918RYM6_9GAMM|nr:ABC transporter permease [Arenicella chitinivorans]GHA13802.1 ABC transporter permease [Arenicella chitinivorans]